MSASPGAGASSEASVREKGKAGPLASAPAPFGLGLTEEAGSMHPRAAAPTAQGKTAWDLPTQPQTFCLGGAGLGAGKPWG